MKLGYLVVDYNYHYLSKLKYLFESAFPPEERPPFSWFVKMDKNQLFGVEDNNEFIGLISIVEYQDLVYLFFLAVKKRYRGKGYGSQILKDLLHKYANKRVFLLAEDPSIPSINQSERDNRIRFYEHNGFKLTETRIVEYGVEYVVLTSNEDVNKDEFLSLMEYLLGNYYHIYRKHVR